MLLVFNASFEKSSNMTVPLKAFRSFRPQVISPQGMYHLIPKLPIRPRPQAFDWSFAPYSGEFDLKRGLPSGAFDFCVKTPVSVASKSVK